MTDRKEFTTELLKVPGINGAYICLPFDAKTVYGKRHMIKVKATIDGVLYRGSLVDMGKGTMMGVTKEIRKKIGKNPGDMVHIILEPDTVERTVTNRKEYIAWITGAKREETRKTRLDQMAGKLLNKKKNPSEK